MKERERGFMKKSISSLIKKGIKIIIYKKLDNKDKSSMVKERTYDTLKS